MAARRWIILFGVLASSTVSAQSPRFAGTGQLQPAPPAVTDGRFSLRASLVPTAPRADTGARFQLQARLDVAGKAACQRPEGIFGNGFESP